MPEEFIETCGLSRRFIVFDGPDGAGKTTIRDCVATGLRKSGLDVTECKDPGGTPIGDRIRSLLLDFDLNAMEKACETLLFMASRAQLVAEVIQPALANGAVVLCDRYVSATCAYQGAVGVDFEEIIRLANYAVGTTWPDLTVILDVPPDVGFARICQRPPSAGSKTRGVGSGGPSSVPLDAMERRSLQFHEKVRENFLLLATRYPTPVEVLDGTRPLEELVDAVLDRLKRLDRGQVSTSPGRLL